jgi:protein-disulfide isomerase
MSKLSIPVSEKDHAQGGGAASCVLVEYGDYQCPSCGEAYPIVKRLQKHFGDRLTFVFRNFPLTQIHPWAEPAAEVAEFAAQHGKFWEMHDLLYENQSNLGETLFAKLAATLALPDSELEKAVAEHSYLARVRSDFTGGVRSGVNGTPTFFIAGQRHNGAYDFDALSDAIEAEIKRASA